MLDLTQPVAVLLNAVLQFIPDDAGPDKIVTMLLDAMPPGSYLVLSQPASDLGSEPRPDPASPLGRLLAQPATRRSHEQVEPVLRRPAAAAARRGPAAEWRPDPAGRAAGPVRGPELWGGAGQK